MLARVFGLVLGRCLVSRGAYVGLRYGNFNVPGVNFMVPNGR